MSEYEDPEFGQERPSGDGTGRELLPPDPEAETGAPPAGSKPLLPVPVFLTATSRAEPIDEPAAARPKISARPLLARAAAIAAAAVLAGGALWAFELHRSQASLLAEQAQETQALTKMIDDLSARLSAMESAKSRDELLELRRSVGEIRSSVASSRDLSGALAQLAQRVEKLDREESAKVDKLNERVDHDASAQAAELAARIEKLEKKVVAAAAPPPAPANPPSPPEKQPPMPPKIGPDVSMETTGSIDQRRPVLRGYIVLGARKDVALVAGRYGERAVRPGDYLPGAGRVERIAHEGGAWSVVTDRGLIPAAADPPY